MKVAIIQYNAGNVRSVSYALQRLGIDPVITDNPETLRMADKVIFPGVGAAGAAMNYLKQSALDEVIISLKQPVLGICLGMQLMSDFSEEGETTCLGIFPGRVKKFTGSEKVPHMGWNNIAHFRGDLFSGITDSEYMYFVHSYYLPVCPETSAVTEYGQSFSAAVQQNNFYGVQFHPEKSGRAGQQLLENFLRL